MSENKRALLSLTGEQVEELRDLILRASRYRDEMPVEKLLDTCQGWDNILSAACHVLNSPVPIHFTDLGTEP